MTDFLTDKQSLQWRQELLNLKEDIKQKIYSSKQALVLAQKIKLENQSNFIKPNFDIQNSHIQLCDTLEQANEILAEYGECGVPLTTTTFNILISLSPDLETSKHYFETLIDQNLKPNTYTLNGFIAKSKTIQQGRDIIKSMNKYGIRPNSQTYNSLLSLTTHDHEREEILNDMEARGIETNLVTFNTLISRSPNLKTALKHYQDLKHRNIKPTINTFVTLLKKTTNEQETIEIENLLRAEKITTNNSWESIRKSKK